MVSIRSLQAWSISAKCSNSVAKEIVSCAQQHHVAQCASCATIAIREGMYIDEVEVSDTRLERG